MNTYEMIYCFKPTLDPDTVDNSINIVETYITNLKGKIVRTEKLGRKRLGYEIRKFRDGFYTTTYFELDPEQITELRRSMKLNDNILREMTVRIEKPDELPAPVTSGFQQQHHHSSHAPQPVQQQVPQPVRSENQGER